MTTAVFCKGVRQRQPIEGTYWLKVPCRGGAGGLRSTGMRVFQASSAVPDTLHRTFLGDGAIEFYHSSQGDGGCIYHRKGPGPLRTLACQIKDPEGMPLLQKAGAGRHFEGSEVHLAVTIAEEVLPAEISSSMQDIRQMDAADLLRAFRKARLVIALDQVLDPVVVSSNFRDSIPAVDLWPEHNPVEAWRKIPFPAVFRERVGIAYNYLSSQLGRTVISEVPGRGVVPFDRGAKSGIAVKEGTPVDVIFFGFEFIPEGSLASAGSMKVTLSLSFAYYYDVQAGSRRFVADYRDELPFYTADTVRAGTEQLYSETLGCVPRLDPRVVGYLDKGVSHNDRFGSVLIRPR